VHSLGAVARGAAAALFTGDAASAGALQAVLIGVLRPTIVPDGAETERRRQAVGRAVRAVRYQVQAGEKIVGAHEVVSSEQFEKLRALRAAWSPPTARASAARVAGAVLYNLIVLVALGMTLALFRPLIYANNRAILLVGAAVLVTLVAAAIVARLDPVRPELVPVAFAALLFGVVFDARISVVAALLVAILVAAQAPFRGNATLFLALIGGVAAAFATRLVRRRNDAFYPIAIIAAAYALGAVTVGLSVGWDAAAVVRSAGWGAANAVGCVSLALMLMPGAEEFTGIDTYPKLLEWSDLNRPLLRRLSIEAPGTYNHTVQIANLAEAACAAIGADGLLARVGAYYHDIGKLRKPQYFVENQQGRNPHDKLKPSTSAAIIRNHVREGIELAEEAGVPASVRAFIAEHHGTGAISYFLDRAREREGPNVNAADFAYPGPVPQTTERAVCMLADGVEAATRALAEPTPAAIREVVERIVRQRIDQGQLRDAPITLRQLEIVKDQFTRMLIASHHQRVDYPAERPSGSMPAVVPGNA
jgi:putative nucleotidyltransferase with HDIG domain